MLINTTKVTKLDVTSSDESPKEAKKSKEAFLEKAYRWASGLWEPNADEEKTFLEDAYTRIGGKIKNNPGALGEYLVRKKFKSLNKELKVEKNVKIDCSNWLPGQKNLKPDLVIGNTVIEVKTLRYINCDGKRGNQGTAVEKIDSIPRKYGGVYENTGKKVLVVLVADQQLEKVGKSWLEAFKGNYNGNGEFFKGEIELCKKLKINMVGFNELSLEHLKDEEKEKDEEPITELNLENIVKSLSKVSIKSNIVSSKIEI